MMVDPGLALTVFFLLSLGTAALFWPGRGIVARVRRGAGHDERVQLEDALKLIHLREREGRTATLEDLAGRLEVTSGRAAEVLALLIEAGLVTSEEAGPVLSDEGRTLARQTIRTHRLWERWLADRTGVAAEEWHSEAERMEHTLSPEETDVLSSRLGHPRYDPHGDPIPTAGGELPPVAGIPLSGVPAGRVVRVLHLEDEPPELFSRLLDKGMAVGVTAEVVDRSSAGVLLKDARGTRRLDPVAAGHVRVELLPLDTPVETERRTLADIPVGRTVPVAGLSPACQGPQRRRLLDLGFVKGGTVTPELVSMSSDPVAYRIRGALIALRREQAEWIWVSENGTPQPAPFGGRN